MFNIGFTELLMIAALALIFIGPKQLPEVARAVGKFLNELRRASDEAVSVFKETHKVSEDFLRKAAEDISTLETDKKPAAEQIEEKPEDKKT